MITDCRSLYNEIQEAFSFIDFHEEGHRYFSYGNPVLSVTGLIKKYTKPFDREFWLPKSAKKHGVTVEELGKIWDQESKIGLECGSHIHSYNQHGLERRYIQLVTHNEEVRSRFEKIKPQCEAWINDNKNCTLASEVVVGNDKIGGQVDHLRNDLWLNDYKTDKEIKYEGFQGQMLLGPLSHLPDCNFIKYSIQTTMYRLLLEAKGFHCPGATIVWFNSANPSYTLINPLFLRDECEFLLRNI